MKNLARASAWCVAWVSVAASAPAVAGEVKTAASAPTQAGAVTPATPEGQVVQTRPIFGVACEIQAVAKDAAAARRTVDAALDEMARIASKYDVGQQTSEVAAINAAATTEEVLLSEETQQMLQRLLDWCRDTGGAVDPTVASFSYLWNLSARPFVRPLPDEVTARRALTGCKQVALKSSRAVRLLKPGVRLTMDAVLHGHALQRAADVLRKAGLDSFRIRVGGDVYVQGHIGTQHWLVTLPHPRRPEETLVQLYLTSQAAASRTDADRFVLRGGKRYHDVIDPRTGQPADGVLQATVVSADPEQADALSNALFVLGPKAGLAMLARHRNVEGFVVDSGGRVFATAGMAGYARLPAKLTP
jgi:thiamine biosynthesis lipoprotein